MLKPSASRHSCIVSNPSLPLVRPARLEGTHRVLIPVDPVATTNNSVIHAVDHRRNSEESAKHQSTRVAAVEQNQMQRAKESEPVRLRFRANNN